MTTTTRRHLLLGTALGLLVMLGSQARAEAADEATAEPEPKTSEVVPTVAHVPIGSAVQGEPLKLAARIEGAWMTTAVSVHYRSGGDADYASRVMDRTETGGFVVEIPGEEVKAPYLEYYLASVDTSGRERLHFAAPEHPHPVVLSESVKAERLRAMLAKHHGARSRFSLRGEYVDFGRPQSEPRIRIWYMFSELDYTYRILGPVYSVRLGFGVIRGSRRPAAGSIFLPPNVAANRRAGYNWGLAEVRFRPIDHLYIDLSVNFGAGSERFEGGAGGAFIIGEDPGTHVALGFNGVTALGESGYLRLAWATVRSFPMSLTIEVTTLPDAAYDAEASGRVIYAVGHRFGEHFTMDARVSYSTRDFGLGSVGGGLGMSVEF